MRSWRGKLAIVLLCLAVCVPAWGWGFNFGFSFGGAKKKGAASEWIDLVQSLAWSGIGAGWSTNTYEFGSHDAGTTTTATFTITNSGNDTAEDVATSVTGAGFRLYSSATFGNISAGRTRVTKVAFTPTGAGVFNGYANYSAPNIARKQIVLSGTGVAPDAAPTTPVITATAGNTLVTIDKPSTESGSPTPSYSLKRGTVSGTRSVVATGISLPYPDTDMTNGAPYYYSLVASNSSGTVESEEVTATPTAPGLAVYSLSTGHTSTQALGSNSTTNYFLGQYVLAGKPSHALSKVDFYFVTKVGDVSAHTLYAAVYTTDAGKALVTLKGVSDGVSANGWINGTVKSFSFSVPVTVDATDAIVIYDPTSEASNYTAWGFKASEGDSEYSAYTRWNISKSLGAHNATQDMEYSAYE